MISDIFRNTFPALFIVWSIYLSELLLADSGEIRNSIYYSQQLKIFIAYTVFGLIIGGLSAGILAVKKKKYAYSFENDIKKYSKYFLKNFGISFLTLFSLLSREVINNPLLFKTTLLNSSFWFSGLFIFIRDKFSPLYFTIFFMIIIAMSIQNLIKNLSLYHGTKRAVGYFSAVLFSILFVFNYGFLNAKSNKAGKNIIFIGAENLDRSHMSGQNIKNRSALKQLKQHSYDFENCFAPVLDEKAILLSLLTSENPEKGEYCDGLISVYPENKTILSLLKDGQYNTADFSDVKFRYDRTDKPNGFDPAFPTVKEILKSKILVSHFISPVLFNNKLRITFFPEARLISDYRERTFLREGLSDIISRKDKNFLIVYTIPDYRDYLPYPYYRLTEEDEEGAYLNYLNDEINVIYEELKKHGRSDDTIICLFGISKHAGGLLSSDYKIPLYISSSEYEIERKVKNHYTTLDILPTVLDAAGLDLKKYSLGGRSFFDPEFIKQDIVLTDISLIKGISDIKSANADGYESKNKNLGKEIFPLLPRSLIISDLKFNSVPDSTGIKYGLYDILKDPGEKNNIIEQNYETAKKMKEILELKMRKDFNYKLINGYVFK